MNIKNPQRRPICLKKRSLFFSDSYLDAVANEINQLYGKREQEINLTDRTKRNK